MMTTPEANLTTTEIMVTSTQDLTAPPTTTTEVVTSMMTSTVDLTTPIMTSAGTNLTTVQPATPTATEESTAPTTTAQTTPDQTTPAPTTDTILPNTTVHQTTMAETTLPLTTDSLTTKLLTTMVPTTKAMSTKEPPKPKIFNAVFRITRGVNFTEDLSDKTSDAFSNLENDIKPLLENVYRNRYGNQLEEVVINAFRSGSVVVDYNVVLAPNTTDVTAEDVTDTFTQALNDSSGDSLLGDFVIDPASITTSAGIRLTLFQLCVRRSRKNSMKGNMYAINEEGRKESLLWMHKKDANGFHGSLVSDGRHDGKTTAQEMREMRSHPSELPLNGSAPINGYGELNYGYVLNAEDNDTYL
uniref:SEA domain-containing protein n=1 Tax=Branchiostoma floridae TaxID=7739 RepID=C3ZJA6_BRAFL|eukprot:XP_002591237.1 hypothetical protein BRAFLDRAFT_76677 [Branchiostoma floridae]